MPPSELRWRAELPRRRCCQSGSDRARRSSPLQFPRLTKTSLSMLAALVCVSAAANESRHVVVVVWDGMRPDFVTEQNTPALWKLAQSGVTFQNHHAVYPSATIVNGTAINTGVYPNRSGVLVNHDYRPEIDAKKSIDVEN